MKNKSVKLAFVTKSSKHLVGTGAENLLAIIEFTPLWKTKVSNYRLWLKIKNMLYLYATKNNRNPSTLTIVKVYEYRFK